VHAAKVANEAGRITARDAAQRAHGVLAGTRRLFRREEVQDDTLADRVRAALGRVVSHPHAIEVAAEHGHVGISGPILAEEVRSLLRTVRTVAGVRGVSDHLTVHQEPDGIPALQGGSPRDRRFELLQDRCDVPPGEYIAGKQKHRNSIDGGGRSPCNHVGRTGSDGGCADEGSQPIIHFGERDGSVHHGLLVAGQIVGKVRILLQRLSNSSYVAVAKNPEATRKKWPLRSVPFRILIFQKQDGSLSHRHSTARRQTASSKDL